MRHNFFNRPSPSNFVSILEILISTFGETNVLDSFNSNSPLNCLKVPFTL